MINMENLDKANWFGVGKYYVPELREENIDVETLEWIPFNYAKTAKDRSNKGVHFYIDDYQFTRLWSRPDAYLHMLQQFGAVCTPDFSLYHEMPLAVQIYNHFRKQWLGAYWQQHGIHVIPTVRWCGMDSFEWCLDGIPKNSIVSISNVGAEINEYEKKCFAEQCRKAIKILTPRKILWYGKTPKLFDNNVIKITPHYESIAERRMLKNG